MTSTESTTTPSLPAGRVQDRIALVTGAAGGIGSATAQRLIEEGARVIAADLEPQQEALEALRASLPDPSDLLPVVADVTDRSSLDAAVARGIEEFGRIDIVFANAGVLLQEPPVEDLPDSTWRTVLDVNLTGVMNTARAVFPVLKQNPNGSAVVLASSTAGIRGGANSSAYTAAKTALVGLAETWAHELGPFGGRVNTTHPTAVGTELVLNRDFMRKFRPDLEDPQPADVVEGFSKGKLLDVPWIDPIDVANAVLFLVSDEARYITGVHLPIDAGSTIKWG